MKDVYKVIGDMKDIYQRTRANQETVIEVRSMLRKEFDDFTDRRLLGIDLEKILNEVNSQLIRFLPDEYGPRPFKYVIKRV